MKKQSNGIHTKRLTLRISENLFERVKRTAADREMSVSAYVRMLLKEQTKGEDNAIQKF